MTNKGKRTRQSGTVPVIFGQRRTAKQQQQDDTELEAALAKQQLLDENEESEQEEESHEVDGSEDAGSEEEINGIEDEDSESDHSQSLNGSSSAVSLNDSVSASEESNEDDAEDDEDGEEDEEISDDDEDEQEIEGGDSDLDEEEKEELLEEQGGDIIDSDEDDNKDSKSRHAPLPDYNQARKVKTVVKKSLEHNLAHESDSEHSENETGQEVKYRNRIGKVPLEWYADYDHIGYDVKGERIVRKAKGDRIDELMMRKDDPNYGRTIYDAVNDVHIVLTDEELQMIERIRKGEAAHGSFDPYADYDGDYYTNQIRHEILGNAQEPKRRFIPSKWEAKRVVKLVHAIRNGWIKTSDQQPVKKPESYLLWAEDGSAIDPHKTPHRLPPSIPPPKPTLPGHAESYNPPPEYLPSTEEKLQWELMDPEDRPQNFVPTMHNSLREVPSYDNTLKERFERCLDLYLCPRARRKKLNIDPESLIPQLPKPQDLRPFPTTCSIEYKGHTDKIRCIQVSPDGQWLASGSDDGTVRLWEVDTGRCFRVWRFDQHLKETDPTVVDCIAWNPNPEYPLLAVCIGTVVILLPTHTSSQQHIDNIQSLLHSPKSAIDTTEGQTEKQINAVKLVHWRVISEKSGGVVGYETEQLPEQGEKVELPANEAGETDDTKRAAEEQLSLLILDINKRVKNVCWHPKGDYFATVGSVGSDASSVLIHRLSQHSSQSPFTKSKGLVSQVLFHTTKPFFFVQTKKHIRIYNLIQQSLMKKLLTPAKWLSSMYLHPSGDHLIAGSYDRRVCWYDLDLSSSPYKTLKYHSRAVRSVAFHPHSPLFASASDDGSLHIFHAKVYNDLVTNPMIVPVKIIQAHSPVNDLGVLSCVFHPTQPWIFSSGADGVIKLFT